MREQVQNLDKIWIKSMEFCAKYWGCHQMPERSFFLFGYQFPVCARCTGILCGQLMAFFLKPLGWMTCVWMTIPMMIDGTLQLITPYQSNQIKRALTGFLFGFAMIQLVKKIIKSIVIQSLAYIAKQ